MSIALMDRVAPYTERVASIAPIARRSAHWSEQNSRPANELVEALRDADPFRLLVPKAMGGAGLSPWELGPVIEALARVDGSARKPMRWPISARRWRRCRSVSHNTSRAQPV